MDPKTVRRARQHGAAGFARGERSLKRHAGNLNRRERTLTRNDSVPSRRARPPKCRDPTRDEAHGRRHTATASQDVPEDRWTVEEPTGTAANASWDPAPPSQLSARSHRNDAEAGGTVRSRAEVDGIPVEEHGPV